GVAVQTWEAAASAFSGPTDAKVTLAPTPALLAPSSSGSAVGSVLLHGTVQGVKAGDELLAVSTSFPTYADSWAKVTVVSTTPEPDPNGGTNTRVVLTADDVTGTRAWMEATQASNCRLLRWRQTAALWTQTDDTAVTDDSETQLEVRLSAVVRGIAEGDLVFLEGGNATTLGLVTATAEIFTGVPYPGATDGTPPDIPIAHTQLTMTAPLAGTLSHPHYTIHSGHIVKESHSSIHASLVFPSSVSVRFALQDAGRLIGTPRTTLTSLPVTVTPHAGFSIAAGGTTGFLEDANGLGIPVGVTDNGDGTLSLAATAATPPSSFSLTVPLRLLVDLVQVSRGKTVAAETLGTGDASVAGQTFTLQNAPLTYLASGADVVSTLQIAVDGIYWTEAKTFYDQPPDATIFVVTQGADGKSVVRFGDGVNGARLPSGSRVVATYRYGAGAAVPPATRLATILKPQQNLASIRNPVGVWGGADAERPEDVREDAPKSVLTFGRAISGDDYETVASLAPGVSRARAYWTWDAARQRCVVKVYVGDDAGAASSARSALAGAEDPNRPVTVTQATPIAVVVNCKLLVAPNRVATDVAAAATASLEELFGPHSMPVGVRLYTSAVESALLVAGVAAVHGLTVTAGGSNIFNHEPVGWADPGEGSFYALSTSAITTQVADG
ncbi:MAG: baseplate J/gp47 family protein, partial [Gaiellaceae bacterium]